MLTKPRPKKLPRYATSRCSRDVQNESPGNCPRWEETRRISQRLFFSSLGSSSEDSNRSHRTQNQLSCKPQRGVAHVRTLTTQARQCTDGRMPLDGVMHANSREGATSPCKNQLKRNELPSGSSFKSLLASLLCVLFSDCRRDCTTFFADIALKYPINLSSSG